MKINFLLPAIITAVISSCSTSYKTGQTPDDVYYSPVRLQNDNVRREDNNKNVYDNSVYTTQGNIEIRRRLHNRRYKNRSYNERYDYPYDRYDYPYGYNGYPQVYYGNPKPGVVSTTNTSHPRKTNLGAYSPNLIKADSSNYNPKTGKFNTGTTYPVRTFDSPGNSSSNNGSGVGNFIRRVFNTDNSSNNSYNNNNSGNSNNSSSSRTFETRSNNNNSSTNSNNSSGSSTTTPGSSTSAPIRTFKKDN